MEQKSTKKLAIKTDWMRDTSEAKGPNAAGDLKWLRRHVDGMNTRLTALYGLDAAYLFNKNHKRISQALKILKSVHDELKTAIIDEMADEKMRERSR